MVKINRKKIEIILLVVIASATILSIKTVNIVNNTQKTEEKISEETVATPASGKVVILDAGHGRRRSEGQLVVMEQLKQN